MQFSYLEIKEKLLKTELFETNNYFDQYIKLICDNSNTLQQKGYTQCHHIIPVSYYKLKKLDIDNSLSNKVNLKFADHLKAHALLCLCVKDHSTFRYRMYAALNKIIGSRGLNNKEQVIDIFLESEEYQKAYEISRAEAKTFNPMKNETIKLEHDKLMRSEEMRSKIRATQKENAKNGVLFNSKHRENLKRSAQNRKSHTGINVSKTGYVGGVTGLKMLYKPDGSGRIYVKPEQINEYLSIGYTRPIKKEFLEENKHIISSQKHTYQRRMDPAMVHKHLSDSHHRPETEQKGSKWMNDGENNHIVHPQKIKMRVEQG